MLAVYSLDTLRSESRFLGWESKVIIGCFLLDP